MSIFSLKKSAAPRKPPLRDQAVEHVISCYGDLLFDLCESVIWNPPHTQTAFRDILRTIRNQSAKARYIEHERAWILRLACDRLRGLAFRYGRRLTPAEQIELDATPSLSTRFEKFGHFFHRLPADDKLLLLLRDKYGLSYPEIASAMAISEGSLRVRRQQALRTLEEWLWDTKE